MKGEVHAIDDDDEREEVLSYGLAWKIGRTLNRLRARKTRCEANVKKKKKYGALKTDDKCNCGEIIQTSDHPQL